MHSLTGPSADPIKVGVSPQPILSAPTAGYPLVLAAQSPWTVRNG